MDSPEAVALTRKFLDWFAVDGAHGYEGRVDAAAIAVFHTLSQEDADDELARWINSTDHTVEDYDVVTERISSFELSGLEPVTPGDSLYERIRNDLIAAHKLIADKYEVNPKALNHKAIADDIADHFHTWSAQWTEDEE